MGQRRVFLAILKEKLKTDSAHFYMLKLRVRGVDMVKVGMTTKIDFKTGGGNSQIRKAIRVTMGFNAFCCPVAHL